MVFTTALILWLLLLTLVVAHLVPKPIGWRKLLLWIGLALLSVLLVHLHILKFG